MALQKVTQTKSGAEFPAAYHRIERVIFDVERKGEDIGSQSQDAQDSDVIRVIVRVYKDEAWFRAGKPWADELQFDVLFDKKSDVSMHDQAYDALKQFALYEDAIDK